MLLRQVQIQHAGHQTHGLTHRNTSKRTSSRNQSRRAGLVEDTPGDNPQGPTEGVFLQWKVNEAMYVGTPQAEFLYEHEKLLKVKISGLHQRLKIQKYCFTIKILYHKVKMMWRKKIYDC